MSRSLCGTRARWLLLTALGAWGCGSNQAQLPSAELERQAVRFMAEYAQDLRAHRREALIGRYDPRGVYVLGNGSKRFLPADTMAARYRTRWQGPAFFEWSDLSYEVIAPSAVVVAGKFLWKAPSRPDTTRVSYTGLLVLHAGQLRIRLEDESAQPAPPGP